MITNITSLIKYVGTYFFYNTIYRYMQLPARSNFQQSCIVVLLFDSLWSKNSKTRYRKLFMVCLAAHWSRKAQKLVIFPCVSWVVIIFSVVGWVVVHIGAVDLSKTKQNNKLIKKGSLSTRLHDDMVTSAQIILWPSGLLYKTWLCSNMKYWSLAPHVPGLRCRFATKPLQD